MIKALLSEPLISELWVIPPVGAQIADSRVRPSSYKKNISKLIFEFGR